MSALLAALVISAQLVATSSRDATLVGSWNFDGATPQGSVPASAGKIAGSFDLASAALRPLGVGNATALRMFGNASAGFVVPKDHAMDGLKEVSIAMWLNNFWGDSTLVKNHAFTVELYRQFIETEASASGGEWKAYPNRCAYLPPGEWHHVVLAFGHGKATLFMDGLECASSGGAGEVTEMGAAAPEPTSVPGYAETDNSYCSDKGGKRIFELKTTLAACTAKCVGP